MGVKALRWLCNNTQLISSYLTVLGLNETGDLAQCAWSYMNDALRSTVFVKYPLEAIACGCMHLAFCKLGQVMPQHWSDCFDVEEEAMKKVGLVECGCCCSEGH